MNVNKIGGARICWIFLSTYVFRAYLYEIVRLPQGDDGYSFPQGLE